MFNIVSVFEANQRIFDKTKHNPLATSIADILSIEFNAEEWRGIADFLTGLYGQDFLKATLHNQKDINMHREKCLIIINDLFAKGLIDHQMYLICLCYLRKLGRTVCAVADIEHIFTKDVLTVRMEKSNTWLQQLIQESTKGVYNILPGTCVASVHIAENIANMPLVKNKTQYLQWIYNTLSQQESKPEYLYNFSHLAYIGKQLLGYTLFRLPEEIKHYTGAYYALLVELDGCPSGVTAEYREVYQKTKPHRENIRKRYLERYLKRGDQDYNVNLGIVSRHDFERVIQSHL
ncbi:MAG: hypothetical protein WC004_00590 [Candidatus Absconditabacterales bacterium]